MATTFTPEQITQRLAQELPAWSYEEGHLTRTYRTGNWRVTMLAANAIAFLAEAANHHPDVSLSYPAVSLRLMTHDAQGITEKDFELATAIEETITWLPAGQKGERQNWVKMAGD